MSNKLMLNVGFGNFVVKSALSAIIQPNSAPIKRFVKQKLHDNKVIDATMGKKLRAVVVLSSDYVVLCGISVSSLIARAEDE